QAGQPVGRAGLLRRRGVPGMLLEPLGPNVRTRAHRPLTTLQLGAAAGAGVMALTSTGDVLLLGVLLGVAAASVETGAASVLAGLVVLGRFGTTSLAALAGAQHVVGPAGTTGPVLLATASWCAAAAVILSTRAEFTVDAVFGVAAASVVLPELAAETMLVAALLAAGLWFALLVDGALVSVGHLHSVPLAAAAGCGAALLVATIDAAAVARPVWVGFALAAASIGLAAGHTATDGAGAVAALAVAVATASLAGRPVARVWAPAAVGLVVAAAC